VNIFEKETTLSNNSNLTAIFKLQTKLKLKFDTSNSSCLMQSLIFSFIELKLVVYSFVFLFAIICVTPVFNFPI